MRIGFIGVGVMGEPMCRNLATKSGHPVVAYDQRTGPLERLREQGVTAAISVQQVAASVDVIFLALPSGAQVDSVCNGPGGILEHARKGQIVVDLGTSPADLAQRLERAFRARGMRFADAPIARTRQAAEQGTLSVMVGGDRDTFETIRPLLFHIGSEVTYCGAAGAGQVFKILNNMVLIETVVALSEAVAVATRAGLDATLFFQTLSKGSADSFALRNHGMKAILLKCFPEKAFSTDYARKDLGYALALAADVGLRLRGAEVADGLLERAADLGFGELYWPVISQIVNGSEDDFASKRR
jgi:3-hydroxyisobutyrate dehydrogenase-like beta-hydroxyacid dehydrogenase